MAIEAVSTVGALSPSAFRRIERRGGPGLAALAPPIEAIGPIRKLAGREQPPESPLALPGAAAPGPLPQNERPAYDRRSASGLLAPSGLLPPSEEKSAAAPEAGEEAAGAASTLDKAAEREKKAKQGKPSERELREDLAKLQAEKAAKDRARLGSASARSGEVQRVLASLKARDGEVRAHESAHIAAGGRYITGGASYSYQTGPDGHQYAVGGEVGIDSSPIPGKPEETIAKMRIVRAAALAPAEPSGADLAVAGAAAQAESSAVAELARSRSEEMAQGGSGGAIGASGASGASGARAYDREGREKESAPGAMLDLVA